MHNTLRRLPTAVVVAAGMAWAGLNAAAQEATPPQPTSQPAAAPAVTEQPPGLCLVLPNGLTTLAWDAKAGEYAIVERAAFADLGDRPRQLMPRRRSAVVVGGETFVIAGDFLLKFDSQLKEARRVKLQRTAQDAGPDSIAIHRQSLLVSAEGALICFSTADLTERGRVPLDIGNGRTKNAHDILVQGDTAYLLDDVVAPLFVFAVDVTDPTKPKIVRRVESAGVNMHLALQWLGGTDGRTWYVHKSSSRRGEVYEDVIKVDADGRFSDAGKFGALRWRRQQGAVPTGLSIATVTESPNPWALVKDYDKGGVCALGRIEAGNDGPQFRQSVEVAAFTRPLVGEAGRGTWPVLRESGPHLVLARLQTETPKIEVFLTGKDHACKKVAETPLSKLKVEAAIDVVPVAAGQPAVGKFVVHEWGVHIRSVVPVLYETPTLIPRSLGGLEMKVVENANADSRSVLAPPGQRVSDLPDFVLRHATEYHPKFHPGAWDKPVLHFYGREGAEVSVAVLTPRGRPLAYWPKPRMVEKDAYRQDLHGYGGLVGPELLGLSWTGRLAAKPAVAPKAVKAGHWWQTIRQVPALWFDTGDASERFIFYEATALQEPTVTGTVGADTLTLINRDACETGPVMVIVNDGKTRRFVSVATIGANQTVTLSRQKIEGADGDAANLLAACRAQWEAFGMFREEAQTIVETWKPDLLDKTGFLVISRMPTPLYDALFPLTIKPQPDQVVRAGVIFDTLPGEDARLAWLPALRTRLEQAADDLAKGDHAARAAARKVLLDNGELAGAVVARMAASADPEARAAAAEFQRARRSARVVMPAFLKPALEKGKAAE